MAEIAKRKTKHIDVCTDPERVIETGQTLFDQISFCHKALPEIHADEVDLTGEFLGRPTALPLFISSMTGGSAHSFRLNKELALAAQEARLPVGTGSIRILYKKPEVFPDFHLRPFAPDVPIFSNIGGQQLVEEEGERFARLIEWNKRLEVDAVAVHLNPGQELFQAGGQQDFRGIKEALVRFIAASPHPVIVKETGFGLAPREIRFLLLAGAAYVDTAGAGGTNWLAVEAEAGEDPQDQAAAAAFDGWGWPTALLLASEGKRSAKLLASGGLRDGMDLAKALALGARAGGFALPLIRAVDQGGKEGVLACFRVWEKTLRAVMVLTGCRNLAALRKTKLIFSPGFRYTLNHIPR